MPLVTIRFGSIKTTEISLDRGSRKVAPSTLCRAVVETINAQLVAVTATTTRPIELRFGVAIAIVPAQIGPSRQLGRAQLSPLQIMTLTLAVGTETCSIGAKGHSSRDPKSSGLKPIVGIAVPRGVQIAPATNSGTCGYAEAKRSKSKMKWLHLLTEGFSS